MAFLDEPGLNQAFIEIGNRLKKKANSSDVNTSMANINTELGKKANKVDVSAALVGKADKTYVDAELGKKANSSDVTSKLNEKIASSEKGKANGVATLGQDGLIPSSQLPSYVDDVIEGYYYNNNFYKDFNLLGVEVTPTTVGNNQLVYQDNSSANKSKYKITFNNVITPESGKIYVCKPLDDNNITILKGNNYNNDSICYRYTGSGYVPISDVPKNVITNIESLSNQIKSLQHNSRNLVYISWSSLKELRDNGKLIEGTQYRITDYQCTTVQEDTQSAGHQFDIIVTANSNNKLNEVARAIQHDGDTYFSKSKLEAWKIWYRLDNDTTHFGWADETNGKGVIYRMIDEWNNDCPYDFKNIQFKRYKITKANSSDLVGKYLGLDESRNPASINVDKNDSKMFYTFSYLGAFQEQTEYEGKVLEDASIIGNTLASFDDSPYGVHNNSIKPVINANNDDMGNIIDINSTETIQILNNIVFLTNIKDDDAYYGCYSNSFGSDCYSNSFGSDCYYNSFGSNCSSNSFGSGCYSNSFGSDCYSNSFGSDCYYNSFGSNCSSNSFGSGCHYNSFGSDCYYNSFGSGCSFNSFGSNCSSNSFGSGCYYNSFGSDCYYNSFGSNCYYNSFGSGCYYNSFGSGCYYNSFGSNCRYNKLDAYYENNTFENGVQRVKFSGVGTVSSKVKNYHIKQGMVFTSSTEHTITAKLGLGYELSVAKQSDGTVVEYCEADLLKTISTTAVTDSAKKLD